MDDDTFPQLDPRPNDDAWEAYLNFVRPLIGASDATGLDAHGVRDLNTALGATIPYEIELFLVMGVPDTFPWRNWNNDPQAQFDEWQDQVRTALGISETELAKVPRLLPIFANVAVPIGLVAHTTQDSTDGADNPGNTVPLLSVDATGVSMAGLDLADWLHKQFDAPLPWWPDNRPEPVPFWGDRANS